MASVPHASGKKVVLAVFAQDEKVSTLFSHLRSYSIDE
jgi:hypothetical protein